MICMINIIQVESGLLIIKYENLDDAAELKKFMDNCEVTLHYHNLNTVHPLALGLEDGDSEC